MDTPVQPAPISRSKSFQYHRSPLVPCSSQCSQRVTSVLFSNIIISFPCIKTVQKWTLETFLFMRNLEDNQQFPARIWHKSKLKRKPGRQNSISSLFSERTFTSSLLEVKDAFKVLVSSLDYMVKLAQYQNGLSTSDKSKHIIYLTLPRPESSCFFECSI